MAKIGEKKEDNEINKFVIQPQNINFVQEMMIKIKNTYFKFKGYKFYIIKNI